MEHGGNHVTMGDLVLVDKFEGLLGVPPIHHDNGSAGNNWR